MQRTGDDGRAVADPRPDALERARAELASVTNHEMRTSMTAVLGLTRLLREGAAGPVTEQQEALLARIEANGQRQLELVEQLLGAAATPDAPTAPRAAQPTEGTIVDLRLVVRRAAAALHERAGRRLRVVLDLGEAPLWVSGDRRRVQRDLDEALTAASAHAARRGGVVRVRCARRADQVVVSVAAGRLGRGVEVALPAA
ncbi:sensor histidine kinase [Nocardioides litoris]|uniref:sensor histidine kinase n=1 Tax=Nocardioides litoris TaxID=1926648 RepID=UPI00111E531B|nr:histidine kinase dimerization/phospho-acceptor domain-containing protein [Nocardioides litoris]